MIETDKLAAERVISATPVSPNEEAFERALRPHKLDEYVTANSLREPPVIAELQRETGRDAVIAESGLEPDRKIDHERPVAEVHRR